MFQFFIFLMLVNSTLYKSFFEFDAEREFPKLSEMVVGYIKNGDIQENYYDLIISKEPIVDLNGLSQVIAWAPNGYLKCDGEVLYPLMQLLMQQGKSGAIVDEDPLATSCSQIVVWKTGIESALSDDVSSDPSGNAISYSLSGGRLGDNLLAFLGAKWLAMKYQLPLFYKPFFHSQYFAFSQKAFDQTFDEEVVVFKESDIDLTKTNTLFILPYFPQSILDFATAGAWALPFFKLDLQDPLFKEAYRAALQPMVNIHLLTLPQDRIKVAVHLRRGGSHEDFFSNSLLYPLKFPPDSYYLDQIRRVYELFDKKPLHIHLFTDAYNQRGIIRKYEKWLKRLNVTLSYSKEQDLFDDFYNISQFDVLIRSSSNFSFIGSLLADLTLNIAPLHAKVEEGIVTIDRYEMTFNKFPNYNQRPL